MGASAEAGPARDGPRGAQPLLSWPRLLLAFAIGAVVGALVALSGAPEVAVLVGWIAAVVALLSWVWVVCWRLDAAGTRRVAEGEGLTKATDTAVLVAAVASLGAVVVALVRSGGGDAGAAVAVVLGLVVVVLSWALVNTVFAFKYARLYYFGTDGGIDFKQQFPPAYSDFAYMAFTVGMSYAVSDTEPASTESRRVALGHALLSYLFGTVVIAVVVNLVTGLSGS